VSVLSTSRPCTQHTGQVRTTLVDGGLALPSRQTRPSPWPQTRTVRRCPPVEDDSSGLRSEHGLRRARHAL
jgi:hypothetical protein